MSLDTNLIQKNSCEWEDFQNLLRMKKFHRKKYQLRLMLKRGSRGAARAAKSLIWSV